MILQAVLEAKVTQVSSPEWKTAKTWKKKKIIPFLNPITEGNYFYLSKTLTYHDYFANSVCGENFVFRFHHPSKTHLFIYISRQDIYATVEAWLLFLLQLLWPVGCSPSTMQWNIDVKSLESWVSHLSWWYHKAAINSVTENQTYHRHIIGYEDITESTCLEINRAFPGGEAFGVFPKKFAKSITSLLVFLPIYLISHLVQHKKASSSFLFLLFLKVYTRVLIVCKYLGSLHNHKQRDHLSLACWLTLYLFLNAVVWVIYQCINNVIII